MNSEVFLQITFVLSFAGTVYFILRKSPEVIALPEKDYFLNAKKLIRRAES